MLPINIPAYKTYCTKYQTKDKMQGRQQFPAICFISYLRVIAVKISHCILKRGCARSKTQVSNQYTNRSFLSISEMIQDYVVQPYYNKVTIFMLKIPYLRCDSDTYFRFSRTINTITRSNDMIHKKYDL